MNDSRPDLPALFKETIALGRARIARCPPSWGRGRSPMVFLFATLLNAGYPREAALGAVSDLRNPETRQWVRGDFWPRVQALVMKNVMDGQDTHPETVFGLSWSSAFETARFRSQGATVGHNVP